MTRRIAENLETLFTLETFSQSVCFCKAGTPLGEREPGQQESKKTQYKTAIFD